MTDIEKIQLLDQLFELEETLNRKNMEYKLLLNGYNREYVDTLTDDQLQQQYDNIISDECEN